MPKSHAQKVNDLFHLLVNLSGNGDKEAFVLFNKIMGARRLVGFSNYIDELLESTSDGFCLKKMLAIEIRSPSLSDQGYLPKMAPYRSPKLVRKEGLWYENRDRMLDLMKNGEPCHLFNHPQTNTTHY